MIFEPRTKYCDINDETNMFDTPVKFADHLISNVFANVKHYPPLLKY